MGGRERAWGNSKDAFGTERCQHRHTTQDEPNPAVISSLRRIRWSCQDPTGAEQFQLRRSRSRWSDIPPSVAPRDECVWWRCGSGFINTDMTDFNSQPAPLPAACDEHPRLLGPRILFPSPHQSGTMPFALQQIAAARHPSCPRLCLKTSVWWRCNSYLMILIPT